MNARETGDSSVRDQSLHPLWEEWVLDPIDAAVADTRSDTLFEKSTLKVSRSR